MSTTNKKDSKAEFSTLQPPIVTNSPYIINYKVWCCFILFLSVARFITFLTLPSVLTGGIQSLCDCSDRPYQSPLHQHKNGYGVWYLSLVWVHFLVAIGIIIPLLISMFSTKGSELHIRSGHAYLVCWIVQIFFGVIAGGIILIGRGPVPGEDQASGGHYWGSFPFTIFILFSFVLSAACEQLGHAMVAIQLKDKQPSLLVHYTFLFGGVMTILNGFNILVFGTMTLANHPTPGSSQAFYPWLYYLFIPVEIFMTVLNLIYWITPVEQRNWLLQHIRCMGWSAFLTFFFVFENLTFKIINTYQVTRLLLLPTWILLLVVFGVFIWWNRKQYQNVPTSDK